MGIDEIIIERFSNIYAEANIESLAQSESFENNFQFALENIFRNPHKLYLIAKIDTKLYQPLCKITFNLLKSLLKRPDMQMTS